jgi:hypothetical protein
LSKDEFDGRQPARSDCLYRFSAVIEICLFTIHSEMMKLVGGLPARIDVFRDADERLQAAHTACLSFPLRRISEPANA